jgi:hypothetical protein
MCCTGSCSSERKRDGGCSFIGLRDDYPCRIAEREREEDAQFQICQKAARLMFSAARSHEFGRGLWISAAGGYLNACAGEIARCTGMSFEAAQDGLCHALRLESGVEDDWLEALFEAAGWDSVNQAIMDDSPGYRPFDARLIARAAVAAVRREA